MLSVTIVSPFDDKMAERAEKSFKKKLRDFRPVFRGLMKILPSEVVAGIKTQGGTLGEKWPPLDPDTVEARRSSRRGRSSRPLVYFGDLLGRAKRGKREYKKKLTSKTLIFGPKVFSDVIAMAGSLKGHVPTRNPVGWTHSIQRRADELLSEKAVNDAKEYLGELTHRSVKRGRSRRLSAERRAARGR